MTDYSWRVDVETRVKFGFGSGPLDPTVTYTDLAARTLNFNTARGRPSVQAHFDAGTATIMLDNYDGDVDPNNSASPYFGDMHPGTPVVIETVWEAGTRPLFAGIVTRWPVAYPLDGHDSVVVIEAVEQMAVLNKILISASYPEQTAHARIGEILDDAGWLLGRVIDTAGSTPLAATTFEGVALDAILAAVDADQGTCWIARGGAFVYLDRLHYSGGVSAATFDPAGAGLDYGDIGAVAYDDDYLINQAIITAGNGETGSKTDAASLTAHGPGLPFEQTLSPLLTGVYAQGVAEWLVAKYKDVFPRVNRLTIHPEIDPANLFDEVLGRDLQDLITVVVTPPGGGDELDQLVSVEGIQHYVTNNSWITTYFCHPVSDIEIQGDFWILGVSDDLGVDTRLA